MFFQVKHTFKKHKKTEAIALLNNLTHKEKENEKERETISIVQKPLTYDGGRVTNFLSFILFMLIDIKIQ